MLKIDELKVSYGGIEAVKGITFEVPERKIVTLIGANGAGKSTTLRTIAGLVRPAAGRIHLQGEDITGPSPDRIVPKGITLVPEGRRVFPDLTVLENLRIGAYLRTDKDSVEEDIQWVYELFPRLQERSWQAAGTLSGGEQQMLAVGRALMSRPKLMMLDEPSLGLAPLVVQDIFSIIREINHQGVTILLIEQNANMALKQDHHVRYRCGAAGQRKGQGSLPGQAQELKKRKRKIPFRKERDLFSRQQRTCCQKHKRQRQEIQRQLPHEFDPAVVGYMAQGQRAHYHRRSGRYDVHQAAGRLEGRNHQVAPYPGKAPQRGDDGDGEGGKAR